jgi:DNA-3-methyladenine glycosylase I
VSGYTVVGAIGDGSEGEVGVPSELVGIDGIPRCPWGNSTPDYAEYHDKEWGVSLHGRDALFERMSLEAFQSGLSWLIILRKREGFRRAFLQFSPPKEAKFDDADITRLLEDTSIVRNRAKILATISNARVIADLDQPLDELLWSFAPPAKKHVRPRTLGDTPATSAESTAMAKDLKKRGFKFLGPTTCYALMQATGMVDDHVRGCWRAKR